MRILIVDDEVMIGRATGRLLKGQGWEVQVESTVEGALQHLKSVDVVLSDWDMPDGGGERVLSEASRVGVPVVIMSGRAEVVEHTWKLEKPASTDAIRSMLLQASGKSAA